MKQLLLTLVCIGIALSSSAQLNVTYRSNVEYNQDLNDIWGYAANGREYALVGLRQGVNVVDVTDPDNPVNLGTPTGPSTTWRDIKIWDHYAFVTNENGDPDQAENGILVIDLSNLPNPLTSADWYYLNPTFPGGGTDAIIDCHNIFIDEFGFAYLTGCNVNQGGTVIYDLKAKPGDLSYVGHTPAIYAHDAYTIDNKLYTSDIYEGTFSIYDVSDKSNLVLLGDQITEAEFTHNVWINDDHTVAFTTDEVAGAPVGSYDISDPSDIKTLDQFRPVETLGAGVIPHNVHVWNDWLIISYYTDGCIIVDGSRPDNLVEVGNFDTFIPSSTGFDGSWGAYPFLPSGTVLVSDIGNGLYILSPDYVRAARLEGTVTEAATGLTLNGVRVTMDQTSEPAQPNLAFSNFEGVYKTGLATAGSYDATFYKLGYVPLTIPVEVENDGITIKDVALGKLNAIVGHVVEAGTDTPIPNANVIVFAGDETLDVYTDGNGEFEIPGLVDGTYLVHVGAWGFQQMSSEVTLSQGYNATFILEAGYEDDFAVDQGWEVAGNPGSGDWELGEPIGTAFQGQQSNPDFDLPDDLGDQCYVTGNGGGGAGTDDVDNGETILTSPAMDLTSIDFPVIEFYYWWLNDGGQGAPNDALTISLSNDAGTVEVASITATTQWQKFTINVPDFLTPDTNVRLILSTSDLEGSGHLVEAALDGFSVLDAASSGIYPGFTADAVTGCTPLTVTYTDLSDSTTTYNWSFPGGTPANSTEASPTVVYDTPGSYAANLQATVSSGNDYSTTKNSYINVIGSAYSAYSYFVDNGVVYFSGSISSADNFTWDFGDGSMSSELNPTHTYSEDGTYTVLLTASNDCGTTSFESEVEIVIVSGVYDELSGGSLDAFPNPFDENFVLQYDLGTENKADLQLYNSSGQLLRTMTLDQKIGQVQMGNDLSPGIYFVGLMINGRQVKHLKMVKQ